MRRVALILGLATCATAGAIGALPGAAAADCSGPILEVAPTSAGRGEQITLTGEAFGDNCYDTGPPPAGEGTLGNPVADIEIVLIQGTAEHVVAQGNADEDYQFSVDVVVPADLQPGGVDLEARAANHLTARSYDTLVISDALPLPSPAAEVATFGPDAPALASEVPEDPEREGERAAEIAANTERDDDSSSALSIIAACAAVAVAAVAAATVILRRRQSA